MSKLRTSEESIPENFRECFKGFGRCLEKKYRHSVIFLLRNCAIEASAVGEEKKTNRTLTPQLNLINFSMTLFCTEGDLVSLKVLTYERLCDRDVVVDIVTVSTLKS